jgi:hypothetical protein
MVQPFFHRRRFFVSGRKCSMEWTSMWRETCFSLHESVYTANHPVDTPFKGPPRFALDFRRGFAIAT